MKEVPFQVPPSFIILVLTVISTDRREWRNLPEESCRSLGCGLCPPLGMTTLWDHCHNKQRWRF